jgi:hypothetical protein
MDARRSIASILLIIVISFLSETAYTQKRNLKANKSKSQTTNKANPKATIPTDNKPFDVTQKSLSPDYLGHNFVMLFDKLDERQSISKKGEYETTEQFRQRVSREQFKPIFGDLSNQSIFAFKTNNFETEYDADNQTLKVYLILNEVYESAEDTLRKSKEIDKTGSPSEILSSLHNPNRAVELKKFLVRKESYPATNAMGVRVNVTSVENKNYLLSISNWRDFMTTEITREFKGRREALALKFIQDAETTKKIRNNLSLLIVCKIVAPSTSSAQKVIDPTLEHPVSINDEYNYLNVKALEFWIYNSLTGEIYQKINANPMSVAAKNSESKTPSSDLIKSDKQPFNEAPQIVTTTPSVKGLTRALKINFMPKPEYSIEAKKSYISGIIILDVTFLATGEIGNIKVVSGNSLLREVSIAAAKQIKFEPAIVNGIPKTITEQIVYKFSQF